MRITSIAYGTRGDVQPALALGKELRSRGHKVRVVVASDFTAMVEQCGLEAATSEIDIQGVLRTAGGLDYIESGKRVSIRKSFKSMRGLFAEHGPGLIDTAYKASDGADVIISGFLSSVFAAAIAEKSGVRHIGAFLQPTPLATRSGPATISAPRPGSDSLLNYLMHKAVIERINWSLTQAPANRFRREVLGLPPQGREGYLESLRTGPTLLGYSPHVIPHPADWPATTHTTGFWFLADTLGWEPDRELLDFLDAGEPPVFLSFGSTTARDANTTTRLLVDAVVQSGRRAVIQAGWAGLGEADPLPDCVHLVGTVPHSWLLSRVSAAVHHGGAGTTAQVMALGIPAVAVPHVGDQPYWGMRIAQLGVGPKAIPRLKLTAPKLAAAIRQMTTDQDMRRRAAELGAKIQAENGVVKAADLIEQYV